jgi:hypothetical protein
MYRVILIVISIIALAACSRSDPVMEVPGGGILTLYGAIDRVDRGPVDPATEPLFARYGIAFETACVLNFGALDAPPQHIVRTDYPAGGTVHGFSGPLVRDVLAIGGVSGGTLIVTALDGYQREIPVTMMIEHDVIFAIRKDGDALPLGGLGPVMLVWPRGTDAALDGMNDDDWVWGVLAIEVR